MHTYALVKRTTFEKKIDEVTSRSLKWETKYTSQRGLLNNFSMNYAENLL